MTNLNRRHIETVLLSYVLLDDTGAAARLLLDIGSSIVWSTPGASELVQELSVWHDDGDGSTPRVFVQQRWHTKDPSYRMYVTDLLERDIPPRGETERAVRESVERLRLVRPTHHS
jgi:hypothetical protein